VEQALIRPAARLPAHPSRQVTEPTQAHLQVVKQRAALDLILLAARPPVLPAEPERTQEAAQRLPAQLFPLGITPMLGLPRQVKQRAGRGLILLAARPPVLPAEPERTQEAAQRPPAQLCPLGITPMLGLRRRVRQYAALVLFHQEVQPAAPPCLLVIMLIQHLPHLLRSLAQLARTRRAVALHALPHLRAATHRARDRTVGLVVRPGRSRQAEHPSAPQCL
jgi:hypothetical protein